MEMSLRILSITLLLSLVNHYVQSKPDEEESCKICRDIVKNFDKGLENTKKHNFGGGNTDWEESRLGSYANSETRLVEIVEKLCNDVAKENQCHAMVEEHEEDFEDWWFKKRKEVELVKYLCMDKVKVCCPDNTYGSSCKECPGGTASPCNGRGSCKGAGTRGGDGTCSCDSGYKGDLCDECDERYYETENKTCEACHEACKDICGGPGPKGCDECKEGWKANEETGCEDVNECEEKTPCSIGQYCENNVGSFKCIGCHSSCDGNCTGPGAQHCEACKGGYTMEEGVGCKDIDECQDETICAPGTFCENTEGSYNCKACDSACESECSGPGSKNCKDCKAGYKREDDDCQDINECATEDVKCPSGQHCENTVGSHKCIACHKACETCLGAGKEGCTKCNQGYTMEGGVCKDINECKTLKPCDKQTEKCFNSPGSYRCGCRTGYNRKDGVCVKEEPGNDPRQRPRESVYLENDHDSLMKELSQGKYVTQWQLKVGAVCYAIFFLLIFYLFRKGYIFGICILVGIYAVVLGAIHYQNRRTHV